MIQLWFFSHSLVMYWELSRMEIKRMIINQFLDSYSAILGIVLSYSLYAMYGKAALVNSTER